MPRSGDHLFRSFRFALYLPKVERVVGCSAVFCDPFSGNMWVERAHQSDQPTLAQLFEVEERVEVWLFEVLAAKDGRARRIAVTWDLPVRWLPFDLDAKASEPAIERVVLLNPKYGDPVDVSYADLPPYIRPVVDPR